jgi:glutamate dehydrogenase
VLAYLHAADAAQAPEIRRKLFALEDKHRQEAVYSALITMQTWLEDATYYLLDQINLPPMDEATAERTNALLADVDRSLPAGSRRRTLQREANLVEQGIPIELAARIVRFRYLTPVLDAVRMAPSMQRQPQNLLWLRLKVTDVMNFMYLHQALDRMVLATPWDGPAISALRRQLNFHLHKLVRLVEGEDVDAMLERYHLREFCQRVAELAEAGPTISGIVMLDDWLRRLLPPLSAIEPGSRPTARAETATRVV